MTASTWTSGIHAVLFDLDGTLADTAPDLGGALNRLRVERGLAPISLDITRPHTSSGARGMIGAGLGIGPDHPEYDQLRARFLDLYAQNICVDTLLFPGMTELLAALEQRKLRWGIVTNKATRFTQPLIAALGLAARASCVVCGDTTPHSKPHPAPLLHASREIGLPPSACLYVGDDLRDVQAARAAGMPVVAVSFGYLGESDPHTWQADSVIEDPLELLEYLPTDNGQQKGH